MQELTTAANLHGERGGVVVYKDSYFRKLYGNSVLILLMASSNFDVVKKSYYLDSCIWLNLFKMEGDSTKGIPYWKLAKDFIERIMFSDEDEIVYSGFVFKELKYKLDKNEFKEKLLFLKNETRFRFVKAVEDDYSFARNLEFKIQYRISFFDCMHVAICKRLGLTLVTRDKELINLSGDYVEVVKPEELLP